MSNHKINKHELIELIQARMIQYHDNIDQIMERPVDGEDICCDNLNTACAVVAELSSLVEHIELHM